MHRLPAGLPENASMTTERCRTFTKQEDAATRLTVGSSGGISMRREATSPTNAPLVAALASWPVPRSAEPSTSRHMKCPASPTVQMTWSEWKTRSSMRCISSSKKSSGSLPNKVLSCSNRFCPLRAPVCDLTCC